MILTDSDAVWLRSPFDELNLHSSKSEIISSRAWWPWAQSKVSNHTHNPTDQISLNEQLYTWEIRWDNPMSVSNSTQPNMGRVDLHSILNTFSSNRSNRSLTHTLEEQEGLIANSLFKDHFLVTLLPHST